MSTRLQAVRDRLAPVLEHVRAGAAERDRERRLPRDEVRALADAGLGRLRVPVAAGGDGLTVPELAEVLVDLAAADPNLPQVFRGHLAFVEDQLAAGDGPRRDAWLARFVAGEVVGNAWTEPGAGSLDRSGTTLRRADGRWLVDGTKFYTTGSIFADWVDVTARDGEEEVTVLVRTAQDGVTVHDDWDGFGQRLTGTGTLVLDSAEVEEHEVAPFSARFRYQTAFYQLVLLSVLAGIAAAVERDAGQQVRGRTRVYSHGNAPSAQEDPQVLAVVGEISAVALTARALVRTVAEAVQAAAGTAAEPGSEADVGANVEAEIRSAQAQVVLSELVPRAATRIFDALGASATRRGAALDAHWRNARTVASHNPVIFKTRIVGAWSVTGAPPPFVWSVGTPQEPAAG